VANAFIHPFIHSPCAAAACDFNKRRIDTGTDGSITPAGPRRRETRPPRRRGRGLASPLCGAGDGWPGTAQADVPVRTADPASLSSSSSSAEGRCPRTDRCRTLLQTTTTTTVFITLETRYSGLSRRHDGSHHERCVRVWAKSPILDRHIRPQVPH